MFKRSAKKSAEGVLPDADYSKSSQYEENFKLLRKVPGSPFGEVTVLSNPNTNVQVMVRERQFHNKAEAGRAIAAARTRIASQSPFGLKLLDYAALKQSELCSTLYVIKQFWESPGQDLRREMMSRKGTSSPFTDAELSYILYRLVKANTNGQHGDLNPVNVAFDRATGTARLIDRADELPSAQRTLNLQQARVAAKQPLYQSPKMYENLQRNNKKFDFNGDKEDAFALGLLLLELGNLRPIANIYDGGKKEFNRKALDEHVQAFKASYGANEFLCSVVEGLIHSDEAQRLGLRELGSKLPDEAEFRARIASGPILMPAPINSTVSSTTVVTHAPVHNIVYEQPVYSAAPPLPERRSMVTVTHYPAQPQPVEVYAGEGLQPVMHEFRTGGSVISPRVIHNYQGPDAQMVRAQHVAANSIMGSYYSPPQEVYVSTVPPPLHETRGLMSASYLNNGLSIEPPAAYRQPSYQTLPPNTITGMEHGSMQRAGSYKLVKSYQDPLFATEVRNY